MEALKKEFERARKKQRTTYDRDGAALADFLAQIRAAQETIRSNPEDGNVKCTVKGLRASLSGTKASQGLRDKAFGKMTKLVDKTFPSNTTQKTYQSGCMDDLRIRQMLCHHLLRRGALSSAEQMAQEAGLEWKALSESFEGMSRIRDHMKGNDWAQVMAWCQGRGFPDLEFKVHRMIIVQMLQQTPPEPVKVLMYLREHMQPFRESHHAEIQRLSGAMLWGGGSRLEASPYSDLLSSSHHDDTVATFLRLYCQVAGLSRESELTVCFQAGLLALPKLQKFMRVLQQTPEDWTYNTHLLLGLELPDDLQFHSVFVCPVSKEPSSPENPPVLMGCGHVLCKKSLLKLSRGNPRFKCPYCPAEQLVASGVTIDIG